MSPGEPSVLVVGYGNPGRLDDGLGPALAEAIEALQIPGVTVDSNYQLNVEDAAGLAGYDVVIFADAAVRGPEPFLFSVLHPSDEASFSTHSLEPEAVLGLAVSLFGARTSAYTLALRGYAFNAFGEELSAGARRNLEAAVRWMEPVLRGRTFALAARQETAILTASKEPS